MKTPITKALTDLKDILDLLYEDVDFAERSVETSRQPIWAADLVVALRRDCHSLLTIPAPVHTRLIEPHAAA